jgi:hypothetical protein
MNINSGVGARLVVIYLRGHRLSAGSAPAAALIPAGIGA